MIVWLVCMNVVTVVMGAMIVAQFSRHSSTTVPAQNIGPLEHVCRVRKGYLLGS